MSWKVAKALEKRVVLLSGSEDALRRSALQELLAESGALDDGFDLESFDGSSSKPDDWLNSCGVAPFLSPRRVAVVRHLLSYNVDGRKKTEESNLLKAFGNLPESALLILVADEEGGSDQRVETAEKRRKVWEKWVESGKGYVEKFPVDKKQVVGRLREYANENGYTMGQSAGEVLVEMVGGSLSRAMEELDKVFIYLGKQHTIREDDLKEIVVASRDWNVFTMVDSALMGRTGVAINQASTLITTADVDRQVPRILSMMLRSLRMAWQARCVLEAGGDADRIPPEVSAGFPSRPNLAQEQPFVRKSAFQLANKLSLRQLAECFVAVAETDAAIKGMAPSFSPGDSLEQLILRFGSIVRGK